MVNITWVGLKEVVSLITGITTLGTTGPLSPSWRKLCKPRNIIVQASYRGQAGVKTSAIPTRVGVAVGGSLEKPV